MEESIKQTSLVRILQGNLLELIEIRYQEECSSEIEKEYLEVLIHYFKGNVERLSQIMSSILNKDIYPLVKMRLMTLETNASHKEIDHLLSQFLESNLGKARIWQAEGLFVAAQCLASVEINKKAGELYKKANLLFSRENCVHKSVKSLLNHLACVSRFDPEISLISDYYYLAKKAKKCGEQVVVGICLLNISREYQLLGAKETALDYVNESIQSLEADYGSKNYYLAIAHRAHLYIELERFNEAKRDYDLLISAKHPAMEESIKVIDKLMGEQSQPKIEILSTSWRERLLRSEIEKAKAKLTVFESKLVELLVEQPRKKEDLVTLLYGNQVDYLSANNRFKVLLSRLRKKRPNLIVSSNGRYQVSDKLVRPNLEREVHA
ncbi:MAG: helix-turn-helix domain-containing protein [Bdellovibrionales bacterium]|nr:helix-turn-helix domain-containing protein [Bdellovibrionales bacterium]